jgi:hypothetical protein
VLEREWADIEEER